MANAILYSKVGRKCVLLLFHEIFADLYLFLFGEKTKLAKKPKAWQISLLLEIIYGGWILIRDTTLSVFEKCKNTEYLTLVNLLDNYVPLVLSIYSIVFKCNSYDLYCQSVLHCWITFVVFHRHHYNKALLLMLSLFQHWKDNAHSMFEIVHQYLVALDEYPVKNFHSILRARTNETDSADQIAFKAKEIDACKHKLYSFKSVFAPPKDSTMVPRECSKYVVTHPKNQIGFGNIYTFNYHYKNIYLAVHVYFIKR